MQEISSVVGDKEHPSWEDLQKMTLVRNCVKETMRLYSPGEWEVRVLDQNAVLHGYKVPAGVSEHEVAVTDHTDSLDMQTTVFYSMSVASSDSNLFRDPKEFKPDRWSTDKFHPFASLPFGFGPRSCYGIRSFIV